MWPKVQIAGISWPRVQTDRLDRLFLAVLAARFSAASMGLGALALVALVACVALALFYPASSPLPPIVGVLMPAVEPFACLGVALGCAAALSGAGRWFPTVTGSVAGVLAYAGWWVVFALIT